MLHDASQIVRRDSVMEVDYTDLWITRQTSSKMVVYTDMGELGLR